MPVNFLGPAHYAEGKFGIRISDVLHVINLPDSSEYFEGDGACQFKDISMVPIQTKMININLLTRQEVSRPSPEPSLKKTAFFHEVL